MDALLRDLRFGVRMLLKRPVLSLAAIVTFGLGIGLTTAVFSILNGLFQTPDEVAKMAIENDVHVVGISSLAAGHKDLVPKLIDELKKQGAGDIKIVVGGIVPPADYEFMHKAGVSAIFGPGTVVTASADQVLNIIGQKT